MATISKTPAGTFKAIIRKHGRVIKTKTFKLKKHARQWAQRIEGDKDAMNAFGLPGASMTLSQLIDEYVNWQTNKDKNISFKASFWSDALGTVKLMDIDGAMIRDALDAYASGKALRGHGTGVKATGRPRAPATVNRMRAFLSSVFGYAIKHKGYVTDNPVRLTPTRTEHNKRERYLTEHERLALLDACKQSAWPKLHLLVTLALTTGARQGELLALHWSDIDWKAKTASLATSKNGEPRTMPLPRPAIEALRPFREVGGNLIFPSEIRWRKPFEFRKHWNRALKDAGIEDFRFHDLRHSAASFLLNAGCTLEEVGQVLGHKSLQTTRRYAHLSIQRKQEVTSRTFDAMEWK